MRLIPIAQVEVAEDRIRRHFDETAIAELAASIAARGLIHAPVIRIVGDQYILIAGERRLRALRKLSEDNAIVYYNGEPLPPGIMPYTIPADLPESELYAIELEENIIRRDISWQERVEAQKKLHDLRIVENPTHTITDTAAVIYGANPTPHETFQTKLNVLLADHLNDPDVAKAKDEREATAIARRKMEKLLVAELAARTDSTSTHHRIYQGSCIDLLPTLPPESVDCMVTDPPYGIGADTFTKQSNAVSGEMHHYDDSFVNAADVVNAIATAACMKPDSHIWMFCDIRRFGAWVAEFEDAGWYVWPHPIIWDKGGVGALMGNANGPRHTYEAILFAQRGNRRISKVFPDVLRVRNEANKDHAAQKPVELYLELINFSCIAGELVLDPCCGSGTIFEAATAAKCKAIGMELNDEQFGNAKLRMMKGDE
jgi:DNA modification methylase